MMYKFIILCGRYRFFSSLSFYHGLDMFLATRDALVINGNYQGFLLPHMGNAYMLRTKTQDSTVNVYTSAILYPVPYIYNLHAYTVSWLASSNNGSSAY